MELERLPEVDFDTFAALDIRSGLVVEAALFPEARKPAIKLLIDFGPGIGQLRSSAQLTRRYTPEELVGTEVLAVVNFPPRRIAGMASQVLVLGVLNPDDPGEVILVRPDRSNTNGWRLG
ncbi:MAG TPA: tRNA-binding protein [Candidatus Nanopelagicaceae bacterium]|nr:tRNA-binding protein [Candidatus Nanopelagicaceae bacterium]